MPKSSRTITLRVEPEQQDFIDAAASLKGQARTAFMLDAAYQAAQAALQDRTTFFLNDETWQAFMQALDKPPADNPELTRLLKSKSPWELHIALQSHCSTAI